MMERFNFEVKIDGQPVNYEVVAESYDAARSALAKAAQLKSLSAGDAIVIVVVAGIGLAVLYLMEKFSNLSLGIGRGGGDQRFGVGTGTKPKTNGQQADMHSDDDKPEEGWPFEAVTVEGNKGIVAGPFDDLDTSYKLLVYTDLSADKLEPIRKLARPYIPKTDDAPESAGLLVLVFPTSAYQVDIGASGIIDAVISDADDLLAKLEYTDIKAHNVDEYITKLKAEAANNLDILIV